MVHSRMNIWLLFIHTHLVPNMYDFFVENKSRISDDCVGLFHTADGHFIDHFSSTLPFKFFWKKSLMLLKSALIW